MYIYNHVPSHVILHHYVSVTLVTIIMVSYNKHKINTEIIVQKCMEKKHSILYVNCLPFIDSNKYLSHAYKIHSDSSTDVSYGCFSSGVT